MREKKWVDCPSCGAKGSMEPKKGLAHRALVKGYSPVEISDLSGQFCTECGDGFWSLESEARMMQVIGRHMAQEDAKRVVASELTRVADAARTLGMTSEAVRKMMFQGRLRYVETKDFRMPLLKAVEAYKEAHVGKKVDRRSKEDDREAKIGRVKGRVGPSAKHVSK